MGKFVLYHFDVKYNENTIRLYLQCKQTNLKKLQQMTQIILSILCDFKI